MSVQYTYIYRLYIYIVCRLSVLSDSSPNHRLHLGQYNHGWFPGSWPVRLPQPNRPRNAIASSASKTSGDVWENLDQTNWFRTHMNFMNSRIPRQTWIPHHQNPEPGTTSAQCLASSLPASTSFLNTRSCKFSASIDPEMIQKYPSRACDILSPPIPEPTGGGWQASQPRFKSLTFLIDASEIWRVSLTTCCGS